MVNRLSKMGINCLTTHYFKGFGLNAEAAEMERVRKFIDCCHRYGILVFTYIQFDSPDNKELNKTILQVKFDSKVWHFFLPYLETYDIVIIS